MPRASRGHALLGLLFLVGLGVSLFAALLELRTQGGPGPLWLPGGLALCGASGWALGQRNLAGLLQLLLFCALTPALVLTAFALATPGENPTAANLALLLLLLAAGPAYGLWRELRRPERLPNVLLELAPPGHIVERDGLQLCAQVAQLSSGAFELRVAVQSCVDRERHLALRLRGPAADRLSYPTRVEARLGPAEVGLLRVTLHPRAQLTAGERLHLRPDISGPPAQRLRHWRPRGYAEGTPTLLKVLLAGSGQLSWRGGWRVPLPVRFGSPTVEGPPPAPTWELLWSPGGAHTAPQPARAA
ncbi:hypothetical protein FGE12_23585 [Aggregicoccus sp. 17bor-14]|uniref:hypothetical protein n=1 Tax=Myxococcaceae TaxID=31 RepID=UPI00129D14B4|nr:MULTISPECIES: hypothetical protein [Myxococcaceae]MBF5045409.1 hypothetical protein [Simulacricoccus sp. 17bor-14]MRI91150.1 hypothetical protein [Aggregicoccus sp. 17bor-14]